jgi:hypothetical protein
MPPGPASPEPQILVILNRATWDLGEGAVKDLFVCHGNGCRPAPLPPGIQSLVIPNRRKEEVGGEKAMRDLLLIQMVSRIRFPSIWNFI